MAKGKIFMSPGMRSFAQLEDLRQKCALGVDTILLSTGGFLPVATMTYWNWKRTLNAAHDIVAGGKNVIITASTINKVGVKMDIAIYLLHRYYRLKILPLPPGVDGMRKKHAAIMLSIKKEIIDILSNAETIDKIVKPTSTSNDRYYDNH